MDNFDLRKYLAEGKLNESSLRAYQIATDIVKHDINFPDDAIRNEDLFLNVIKALTDVLYEKAADMFDKRAGSAPDEY